MEAIEKLLIITAIAAFEKDIGSANPIGGRSAIVKWKWGRSRKFVHIGTKNLKNSACISILQCKSHLYPQKSKTHCPDFGGT